MRKSFICHCEQLLLLISDYRLYRCNNRTALPLNTLDRSASEQSASASFISLTLSGHGLSGCG
jgi:hypothetical protein